MSWGLVSYNFLLWLRKHLGLLVFAVVLAIYILSLNGMWATDHPSSFVQLDWSIWSNHSFSVNDATNSTNPIYSMDDFSYGGLWYIASAPGTAIFALPFVIPAFILSGHTPFGYVLIFTEGFVALMGAISVYLLYKISRMFFREKTAVFLALALGLSTLLWPFATYLFQHDVSTAFVVLAAYLSLIISHEWYYKPGKIRWLSKGTVLSALCGLAIGAALMVDYVNALMIPILTLYLGYSSWRVLGINQRLLFRILAFIGGSSTGILAILWYNQAAFGTIFTTSQNLYDGKPLLGDFTTPLYQGLFINLLSPYRGLFIYCPILILAPVGFYFMLRTRPEKSSILFFIAMIGAVVIPYSMWQDVTAGVSFGPRFIIPAIPFLILPIGEVIEKRRSAKGLAYLLFGLGVVFNGSAALVSVIYPNFPVAPSWTTEIILPVINALRSGELDVWWRVEAGGSWWVIVLGIVGISIVLPMVADQLLRKKGERVRKMDTREEAIIEVEVSPVTREKSKN
jgi:hypothetical protein